MDWAALFQFSTPVALAAIGETVGQRAGVINIGLEGTMLTGAYAAVAGTIATGSPWLGLLIGMFFGMGLTLLTGWFAVSLQADQVVVGTAINLLALGVTGNLFETRFGQTGALLSVRSLPTWHGYDFVMIFTLLSALGATWLIARTAWGLALRAAGEFPRATEAAGFSVAGVRYQAIALAGALGGLGGAYLALGVVGSFAENMTGGRGFIAIAMVTFGRWKPVYVLFASLLIGYLDSLQYVLQAQGSRIPYQLVIALPYVAALAVLVTVGKGTISPAALGKPYEKGK